MNQAKLQLNSTVSDCPVFSCEEHYNQLLDDTVFHRKNPPQVKITLIIYNETLLNLFTLIIIAVSSDPVI